MTRYPLLHIVFHGNIHDTLYINVDEFHHKTVSAEISRDENYEFFPKPLDNTISGVLKSFEPANFAVERAVMPRKPETNLEIEARPTSLKQR